MMVGGSGIASDAALMSSGAEHGDCAGEVICKKAEPECRPAYRRHERRSHW